MKIKFLDAKQVGKKLKKLMDSTEEFYWAIAWATDIEFANSLLENEDKICQLIIGTDFSQTNPEVLRVLQEVENVHIMQSNGNATFHPKVYCFVKGEKVYAIVGSSNLTKGGTYRNEEASVLIEGTLDDEPLQEILNAVSSWWDEGCRIEDDWLNAYKLRWDNDQQHKTALEKPLKIYQPNPDAEHSDLLFKTWDDYVVALHEAMNDEDETIKERLKTLERARKLFANGHFDELNEQQRRAIAGLTNGGNLGTDLERFGWAAFGNMDRARVFNDAIKNNGADTIKHISRALDYISFTGEIFENDYINFKREFMLAFPNGGVAIGCTTRLLAMKRPDYFICANGANKERLAADFGFAPSTLNLDNYWERVVEPIIQSRWWNEQRPANDERMIWNTRAAMLDVIYYEW